MKALALKLPAGDLGTDCTIAAMTAIAHDAGWNHAGLIEHAWQAAAPDGRRTLYALWRWLHLARQFKRDPKGVEHVRTPARFLPAMIAGKRPAMDCDDLATIGVAMLLHVEERSACFVVLGKRSAPAPFVHVFFGARHPMGAFTPGVSLEDNTAPTGFVPLDPQEARRVPFGKMAKAARFRVYPV